MDKCKGIAIYIKKVNYSALPHIKGKTNLRRKKIFRRSEKVLKK